MKFFSEAVSYQDAIDAIFDDHHNVKSLRVLIENPIQIRCIAKALEENNNLERVVLCSSPHTKLTDHPLAQQYAKQLQATLDRNTIIKSSPELQAQLQSVQQSVPVFVLD